MINNTNEVTNFDQLMEKYLKDKNQILSKYDYKTPLKEISPMEPLIFQNDYTPTNNINSNKLQNYESLYNNNNNFEPINNNIKKYPYMENVYDLNENENKFITPIKPITQKNSNSYINSSIEREKALKEEKKKKQMEYRKILDEQIMNKKERQKKEKEKRLEEDKLYEEKFKLENEQYEQQKKANNKQYRNISNLFSEENSQQINSKPPNLILGNNNINNNNNLNQENEQDENIQNEPINNQNVLKRNKSQPYFDIINNNNNNNLFQNIPNQKYQIPPSYLGIESQNPELKENQIFQNQNQPQSSIPIEHLVSTSTQIPAQFLNPRNQNFIRPPYKTQSNYYPSNRQNQNNQNINLNYNQNNPVLSSQRQEINPYLTQRQYNEYHPQPKLQRASSDLGLNTNISISPSNFPTCYQMPFNNNLMNSSPNVNFNNNSQNVNELLNMNINNQNYFGKIIEMFFHEQEKILESYKETIEKLKNERDEAIYRNKASEEKLLALQKMQNDQELLEKNLGYFPLKNGYQQNMERTLDSIMQKNENEYYNNNINNKNNLKENKDEPIINNINDNSNISDSKMASLITSTKFVKVNNGDDKELLETWKKEDKEEKSKNNKKNIKENNNNEINTKNKFRFNGMDTNSFMEKINSINNKILEPPEEPQKYLNANNSSLISKTQKIDEKSFTNEISNINSNKDTSNNNIINNINTEENIINNNIDITDNTNIKEEISIYTKKEKDDSELNNNNNNSEIEIKNKDIMLNNVHNIVMENLDNNISYSTQLKEKLEKERKLQEQKKIGNTSEKEDKISHYTEIEKTKYKDYTFKQLNFSNTKNTDFNNQMNKIKINPNLKNIDNNLTVSSKKNEKEKEKNPFDNIVSLNDDEEENVINTDINNNTNTNKNTINKTKNEYIDEDINDIPNQDSPRNNDSQNFDIQRNTDTENKNEQSYYSTNRKEEEIMNRLHFFDEDNLSPKIKLEKKPSKINEKFNNINLELNNSSFKDNPDLLDNQMNNSIPNNNINELSKKSIRPLNNLSKEKITSLNNLYDEFKKKKDTLNETNNSVINKSVHNHKDNNNSLLNESLNTFTQNLNKKWKDLTKNDINNIKNRREKLYNDESSNNNIIENNTTLEYDKFEDEKIFDKVNQFTKVALNELKQSELSVFNKEKTIKKYN